MQSSHVRATPDPSSCLPSLDALENVLRSFLEYPPSTPEGESRVAARGRPPVLPAALLWTGMLVCILRGFRSQLELWRLLTQWGLWNFPRVAVSDMAIYKRLERSPATAMQDLFTRLTSALQEEWAQLSSVPYADFATAIVALDQTKLDPVLRKLKILRRTPEEVAEKPQVPVLAGALRCLFDVRRQQWLKVDYIANPYQNEKKEAETVLQDLPKGTLLLFDMGYFSFPWLDRLSENGYWFAARLPSKTTFETVHIHFAGGNSQTRLLDALVYLGVHRADKAAHPVRLVEIGVGGQTYRYVTNVLDPRSLPAWQVAGLYQRRWDIEGVFNLIKTHLGLELLFSARENVLLQQIFATLAIAQVVLALRAEIALRSRADIREVSIALLVRHLPQLAADGKDPIEMYVSRGRAAGCIRPFRGKKYTVLTVAEEEYSLPEAPPPKRPHRYAGKVGRGKHNTRPQKRSQTGRKWSTKK